MRRKIWLFLAVMVQHLELSGRELELRHLFVIPRMLCTTKHYTLSKSAMLTCARACLNTRGVNVLMPSLCSVWKWTCCRPHLATNSCSEAGERMSAHWNASKYIASSDQFMGAPIVKYIRWLRVNILKHLNGVSECLKAMGFRRWWQRTKLGIDTQIGWALIWFVQL